VGVFLFFLFLFFLFVGSLFVFDLVFCVDVFQLLFKCFDSILNLLHFFKLSLFFLYRTFGNQFLWLHAFGDFFFNCFENGWGNQSGRAIFGYSDTLFWTILSSRSIDLDINWCGSGSNFNLNTLRGSLHWCRSSNFFSCRFILVKLDFDRALLLLLFLVFFGLFFLLGVRFRFFLLILLLPLFLILLLLFRFGR